MNVSDILNSIQEYQSEGNDLSVLTSAIQSALSASKTPLGLNQWQPDDKPRMEHFNEDNRKIDELIQALREELSNKADISNLKRCELDYSTDYKKLSNSHYTKDSLGFVDIHLTTTRNGGTIQDGDVIAVMPEGFRPFATLSFPSMYHNPFIIGLLNVHTDGRITVRANVGTQVTVYSYIRFFAGTL